MTVSGRERFGSRAVARRRHQRIALSLGALAPSGALPRFGYRHIQALLWQRWVTGPNRQPTANR